MKLKYYVLYTQDDLLVITQDGGVGCSTIDSREFALSEYYQSRLTKDSKFETMYDELSEGKMYCKDWDEAGKEKRVLDQEVELDILNWLVCSTEPIEIVRVELKDLTAEIFQNIIDELILE